MLDRFKRSSPADAGPAPAESGSGTAVREHESAGDTGAGQSRFTRDSDGDGIPDAQERDGATTTRDRHGDGIPDAQERDGATTTRDPDRDRDGIRDDEERTAVHDRHDVAVATPAALATARARQRDEFGGVNWGAAFFGWLVAVGIAALLTAILAAAGAAIGLVDTADVNSSSSVEQIGVGGGIALLVVLMLAYYAGGYVAGRMSRFDGGRQGLGTWVFGLIVTVLLALAAVVLGDQYNVLEQLNLPSLPVGDQTLATGGLIALAAIVVGTILAAMAGGKVGERYHRRIDRAGFVD
jgi:hypothetical protein